MGEKIDDIHFRDILLFSLVNYHLWRPGCKVIRGEAARKNTPEVIQAVATIFQGLSATCVTG